MSVSYAQEGDKAAVMVMRCYCDSHPFQDRRIILDEQIKVGRSVGRTRAYTTNAIFDCKVLSRNHALIWYKDGRFWLRDTNSSNGTFVNNTRMTKRVDEEPAERELFSGDIIRFGVNVVENDTTHGSIITQITLHLPNGDEACPNSSRDHSEQLFLLANSINKALNHEQILETKLDLMKTLLDETQKISGDGWQAMLNEEHLLEKLNVYEAQLSLLKQNLSEETLQGLVTELQERNYNLKNTTDVTLERAISEKMEALVKAKELETCLANSERDCSRLREECESTKEAYQSITVNLNVKVSELEQLEKQLKEVVEEKHRLEGKLLERSGDLQVLKDKLATALCGQVPLKSTVVNSISDSQPGDNNKQTAMVVNGLNNGEAVEPADLLGDVVEITGQLQTSLSQRADEVREELALAELDELDRFCDIQERLANSESSLEHMLDSAYQDISNHISTRTSVLSTQCQSVELIKALQNELELLTTLKASLSNRPSSGLVVDPVTGDEHRQTATTAPSPPDSNDCSVTTTTATSTSSASSPLEKADKFSAALDRAKRLAVLAVHASQTQSSDAVSSLSTNTVSSGAQPQTSDDVVASLVSTQSSRPGDDEALGGWSLQKTGYPGQQQPDQLIGEGQQHLEELEDASTVTTYVPIVDSVAQSSVSDTPSSDDELARLRAELRVSSSETEMYRQLSEKLKCQDDAKAELLLSVRGECDALRWRIGQIESEVASNRAEHQRLVLDAKRSRAEVEELRASRDQLVSELSVSAARIKQLVRVTTGMPLGVAEQTHDQQSSSSVDVVPNREEQGLLATPDRSPVCPSSFADADSAAAAEPLTEETAVLSVNGVRTRLSPVVDPPQLVRSVGAQSSLSLFTVIPVMVLLCALMAYILSKFKP